MSAFVMPDRAMPPQAPDGPPSPATVADNTRAEDALTGFITAKQDALFNAPDAFYRTEGEDAIHAAPVVLGNLSQLRDDALDGLGNDVQRKKAGAAIDAHLELARGDIARHVAEQSLAWQRQTAQDRIEALTREAALHHNDDGLVEAIGNAAANAARAHMRVGDPPLDTDAEDAAAAKAQSGVFNAAIMARLGLGNTASAATTFDRLREQLDPTHAEPLQAQIESAQRLDAAKAYADQLVPATPASSADEIETQRQAALQLAATDHADDPARQALAQHHIDVGFDAHRTTLDQADAARTAALQQWLTTPDAAGNAQTAPPPPILWNKLGPQEQAWVLKQLRSNGRFSDADEQGSGGNTVSDASPNIVQAQYKTGQAMPPAQDARQDDTQVAKAPAASAKLIPPEEIAYPSEAEKKQMVEGVDAATNRQQAMERRKATWEGMLRQLPGSAQAPLPEDWRAEVNKVDPTYAKLTEDAAKKYGIPPELLARLLAKESNYDKNAVNGGFKGIPQIGNAALKDIGVDPTGFGRASAETQIAAGAAYLARQYAALHDWPQAVAAYHHGLRAIQNWHNGIGPGYDSDAELKRPYVDEAGKLRVPSAKPGREEKAANDAGRGRWKELGSELPYVFLGDARRYDGVGHP